MTHHTSTLVMLIIVTVVILAICVALMCVRVIFKKNGRFRAGHACQFDQSRHKAGKTPPPLPKKKTK